MKETAKRSPEFYEFMEFLKEGTKRTDAELKKHREEFEAELKKHREEFNSEMKARDERFEAERKKSRADYDERQRQADERQRELDASMKALQHSYKAVGKFLRSVGEQLSGLGFNAGYSAEEFFFRSLEIQSELGGMYFDRVDRRKRKNPQSAEIDIALVNGSSVVAIEVKHGIAKNLLRELPSMAKKKIREARLWYPGHREYYFGIASMSTYEELIEKAQELGIFLLTQKGGEVEVCNDKVRAY